MYIIAFYLVFLENKIVSGLASESLFMFLQTKESSAHTGDNYLRSNEVTMVIAKCEENVRWFFNKFET